jgi:hypothetical protein
MEERSARASGRVAVLEDSRWRMRLERSMEEASEAAAGAWDASARRSGSMRSTASWSWDAVATETEKTGRFIRREAEHDGIYVRRGGPTEGVSERG